MVRQLTAMRKRMPALQADGKFKLVYCVPNKYPLIYLRQAGKQKILVAINPSGKSTKTAFQVAVAKTIKNIIAAGVELKSHNNKFTIEMNRISYGIFELK